MRHNNTPIAIVGIACRFPGSADSPQDFWDILRESKDVISEIDDSRFSTTYYHHPDPKTPGKSHTWAAGVLQNIDAFDARFFGISPREAAQMDPQQRILLELAWEALEDGGQLPQHLAGSDCGVYVGISNMDYANSRFDDPSSGDAYFMTGGVLSIAANRVSYFLNLHGPSMSIDTACSSSLVAVHQACESMARGECSMALVGGVNLLLTPYPFIGFSNASMLSPSGRCRAFDAASDGYVRAEGGAMLFLKPLDQAQADGDRIQGVIVASGTNSDGRTPGLSLPNVKAQEQLLRTVYERAGLEPGDLRYIEAHGTGTAAGDPVEANAIGHAIAAARDHDDPLLIGSVKTNIGHLEPAAGLAGLMKVILSLKHRVIPPSLHFKTPNPNIRFDDLNLRVVTELTPIANGAPPVAMGVNSFGFGGANAHVVVREYRSPVIQRRMHRHRIRVPLFLSAQTSNALMDMANAYRTRMDHPEHDLYDVKYTAAARRQRFDHRLAVLGDEPPEIGSRLDDFINGRRARGVVSGQVLGRPARLALLFSGNGAQWAGMGCRLLDQDAEFRDWVGKVDELLRSMAGYSVMEELRRPAGESLLHLTQIAQPALFALQVGLFEGLLSKGLQPEAVFGHSVGEVSAAYASGAYTLEQATRVIHERSMAQAVTQGLGKLAAVGMPADAVREALASDGAELEIAAINSPSSVTLTGPEAQLEAFGEKVKSRGALFRILDLDYPFHSRVMDSLRNGLVRSLYDLKAYKTRLPLVSTVTGAVLESEYLDAEYWWQNVRKPVRFDKAMDTLMEDGFQVFMEVGPHPVLQGYLWENLKAAGHSGRPISTLHRGQDDETRLLESLCMAHVLGCPLDIGKLFPVHGEAVPLPQYPWQRERMWFESTSEDFGLMTRAMAHPLLGYRLPQVEGIWENELDLERMPSLADHKVGGAVVFPAAAFIEMALAAALETHPDSIPVIEYLDIRTPLVLDSGVTRRVRLTLNTEDGAFAIQSLVRFSDKAWTVHVTGRLTRQTQSGLEGRPHALEANRETVRIEGREIYAYADKLGLAYGRSFNQLSHVECGAGFGIAHLQSDGVNRGDPRAGEYHLPPNRLDACFHGLLGLAREHLGASATMAYLPVHIGRVLYVGGGRDVSIARIVLTKVRPRSVTASFELMDRDHRLVARLRKVRFRRVQLVRDENQALPVYDNVAIRHWPDRLGHAGAMPAIDSLAEFAGESFSAHRSAPQRSAYLQAGLPKIHNLLASFLAEAVSRAAGHGEWLAHEEIVSALGVTSGQRVGFEQLLGTLEEEGCVERNQGKIRLTNVVKLSDLHATWRGLVDDFPDYHAELTLAGRCGMYMTDILSGKRDPGEVVSAAALAQMKDASPNYRIPIRCLGELVRKLVGEWRHRRPIRILEIAAGEAPAGMGLKGELDTDRAVIKRARYLPGDGHSRIGEPAPNGDRVQAPGFVLDDSKVPPQGSGFDVVVVPWLLHEIRDLPAALRALGGLLARDGLLVVAEQSPTRLLNFIHGFTPGWWRPERTGLQHRSSLLTPEAWREKLLQAGFAAVQVVPECAEAPGAAGVILIARSGESTVRAGSGKEVPARRFMLLAGSRGESRMLAEDLDARLRESGHQVVLVFEDPRFRRLGANQFAINPGDAGDFDQLFRILEGEGKTCSDVIHLMGMTLSADADGTQLLDIQERRCLSVIRMVQALLAVKPGSVPGIWLTTARAGMLDFADDSVEKLRPIPSQAPLWGLGRVIANEHADIQCHLVDLWVNEGATNAAGLLVDELHRDDGEREVVLTADGRYVSRMRRAEIGSREKPGPVPPEKSRQRAVTLHTDRPGSLSQLSWRIVEPRRPGPGQVEVRPQATGLNFRDLMYASGLLPEEAIENGYAGATLGMECAGVVTGVGAGVKNLKVGDEVMGFAPACFSSRIITDARTLLPKPAGWSFEQAATVPVAFFTVYYALHHLARLERGERLLIHGAAGAVGIAAIQYARFRGAEIFASAGSQEKRDILQLLGVDHVLDSRSLDFADQIMILTDGDGVDVVLNSLSGEALRRSLSVLRPFGRFLELGKRDFFENTKIGLRPFRENLAYFGIDADQLLIERPDTANGVLSEVMELFSRGVFKPLPHRVFPASRVGDAFRYMQRSEHIGKIVVTRDDSKLDVQAEDRTHTGYALEPGASYLVTGGLSGFGLATAHWMVEQGARCLALLGRSGANTAEARARIAEFEAMGAAVHVIQADVTDFASIKSAFDRIDGELPPLRGLVHSAMVVDDGLVRNLDGKRMRRVLAPKLLGAWNLHRLTRDRALDFFILYSSATTSFGNPGLGNYVAANAYLESVARMRRAQGLPATAVSWGPISDSGYLARNDAALQALTAFMGSGGLTTKQGFKVLERMLESNAGGGAVLEFDWSVVRRTLPTAHLKRFELFNREREPDDKREQANGNIRQILAQLPPEEARAAVTEIVTQVIGEILRLSPEQVGHDLSIVELGMDSLMAIEMHMSITSRLGIDLPVMGLADLPTVTQLVDKILKYGQPDSAAGDDPSEAPADESPIVARAGTGD